jgi:hypothetical protein
MKCVTEEEEDDDDYDDNDNDDTICPQLKELENWSCS